MSADLACDTKGLAIDLRFFYTAGEIQALSVWSRRETDLLRGQPRGIHAWLRVSELLLVGQVGLLVRCWYRHSG